MKGPILCFVGPPGVGKTSLGQSIARAMNRKFVRISLGGVRDEAEIRGHRRTYIGAIPGRIVQALKQAGAMNPVFMLDEIDKISAGFQGDPAAALLEVLDPAQNHSFRDHYLEINVDLSRVLFIATSNQLGTIHPALLDRMEIISLAGYSEEEKLHIARRYLMPRQLERARADAGRRSRSRTPRCGGSSREYTREAGVRNLERQIGAVAAQGRRPGRRPTRRTRPTPTDGRPPTTCRRLPRPAAIPRRGRVPRVAARRGDRRRLDRSRRRRAVHRSDPAARRDTTNMILTGQLGNVMQESARAAVSHIRATADELGVPPDFLDKHDLHVHVPAGAIPEGRPVGRRHDGDGDPVGAAATSRSARTSR